MPLIWERQHELVLDHSGVSVLTYSPSSPKEQRDDIQPFFKLGTEAKKPEPIYTNIMVEGRALVLLLIMLFILSRALYLFHFERKQFKSFSHACNFSSATERSAFILTNIFMTSHIS